MAHVDHGKTTIADQLLAMNHIVSKRLAGTVRYLDDREDEQTRGITMKSSSVSLLWQSPLDKSMLLMNLVDTPGHIDFATEVAAAVRLCDGAFIVVDIVEGICIQTKEAIRQAFEEGVKMILVINKIDKSMLELNKDVNEIFNDILRIVENCNAYIADLIRYTDEDLDEVEYLFSPDVGNVIFASAVHGWGFTLHCIAYLFIDKVEGETIKSLAKKMWNFDNYIDAKTKLVTPGAIKKGKENLFVQLCLKTIQHVYNSIVVRMEKHKVDDIIKKLKLPNVTRDMHHTDPKVQVKAILQAWSPLADTMLIQSKILVPSPQDIHPRKMKYMTNYSNILENNYKQQFAEKTMSILKQCSVEDPTIVYVSKTFSVNKRNLSQYRSKTFGEDLKKHENFAIIALARVFAGKLTVGKELYFLSPSYDPTIPDQSEYKKVVVTELYILLGRELVSVDFVEAGNLCGIGGVDLIPRRGTLSSDLDLFPFVERPVTEPIVRNSVEPVHPRDLTELRTALHFLTSSDSCVQVKIQENGEIVLITAGDVHLAKCMEDLKKFTDVPISLSEPMVSLRETVVSPENYNFLTDTSLLIKDRCAQVPLDLSVVAVTLPKTISTAICENFEILRTAELHQQRSGIDIIFKRNQDVPLNPSEFKTFKNPRSIKAMEQVRKHLEQVFFDANFENLDKNIWSVGQSRENTNLLIASVPDYERSIFKTLDERDFRSCFDHCVVKAFHNLCRAGPLCGEPLMNCAFIVKSFEIDGKDVELTPQNAAAVEMFARNCFIEAFEICDPHLMEPIFNTVIQVNTSILGK